MSGFALYRKDMSNQYSYYGTKDVHGKYGKIYGGGEGLYTLYMLVYRTGGRIKRFIKIGHTNNLKRRFRALDCSCPEELRIINTIDHPDKKFILGIEKYFKEEYKVFRAKREWYFYATELTDKLTEIKNGIR